MVKQFLVGKARDAHEQHGVDHHPSGQSPTTLFGLPALTNDPVDQFRRADGGKQAEVEVTRVYEGCCAGGRLMEHAVRELWRRQIHQQILENQDRFGG
jgi:hypothetical protein